MKNRLIFNYNSLSFLGKISLWLGNMVIIDSLKPGKWLDILSGYSSLLQLSRAEDNKYKFYSLDFKLDQALKKKGIMLNECKIKDKLPYIGNLFDNITIINGLEHLEAGQEILNEIFRVLRKDGVLQIIVPTWFGKPILEFYAFKIKNKQAMIEMNDHKLYFDEKTLWPMLVKAGFKPENIQLKRIKFYCSLYAKAIKE